MLYRPISETIRNFVLPDIQKRIDKGHFSKEQLPIELEHFRAYQQKKADGNINSVVEINEEVSLICRTKLKDKKFKKDMIGKHFRLNEVKTDEFHILPPEFEGKPCAYFYFSRIYLNPRYYFDLRPNNPIQEDYDPKLKYPIEDIVREKNYLNAIKPYEKLEYLIKNNWPPTPSYYPDIFGKLHRAGSEPSPEKIMQEIASSLNKEFWDEKISFWKEINLFAGRLGYIEKSIQEYFEKDYVSSIYVLCPQFEGIIRNYLKENQKKSVNYRGDLDTLRSLLYSRKILLYPKKILDTILDYLKDGTFTQRTKKITDPRKQVNRHGIVHGIFSGFESEELALKLLILLDSLAFILLSDKISQGQV